MEWLIDRFDPNGADRRKQIRGLKRDVGEVIEQIYTDPKVFIKGQVYNLYLPDPYQFTIIGEVYWGFPAIDEMSFGRSDPGDRFRIVMHSNRQSWVIDLSYSNRISEVVTPRTIDFGDEILRLKVIKETLGVVSLNKSRAEVVKPIFDVIPT